MSGMRSGEFNPIKWLSEKLEKISMGEYIRQIEDNFDKEELYKAHTWTPLKLIALMYWLTVYSRIVPKRFSNCWYIDLLASSGANVITETGDIILGSPLLSYLVPYEPFKHHIFVELDSQKQKTLDRMLKHFGLSDYDILKGDCNKKVRDIPFSDIDHYFCFIDCEGLDVKMSTLKYLLRYRGDVLLVFQTSSVNRVFGKAKRGGYNMRALDDFCGGDWWQSCSDIEDLLNKYISSVKQKTDSSRGFENFVDHVRIKGKGGGFIYEVILICRKGDYIRAWLDLKKKLEALEDEDVKIALKICKGELRMLDEFFGQTAFRQTKLDSFLGR